VGVCTAFNPNAHGKERPKPSSYKAIWDTGATGSVITSKVVQDLSLKATGVQQVQTSKGHYTANTYDINIILPNGVGFAQLEVIDGDIGGDCDVLIGMDIISQGDFAVTNKDGKTVFSYRVPSVAHIDFVKEVKTPIRGDLPKVGRNAPCPCGSGKKYKQCCGKK